MSTPSQRLEALGLVLPSPAAAVAAYVPFVVQAGWVVISGQLPMQDGALTCTGRVGESVTIEQAKQAAQLCGLNILAQAAAAAGGDLNRVAQVIRLGGFVASAADFYEQPKVINGASELMQAVLGDAGRHARAAVGVNVLPLNASVEIEALVRLHG